MSLKKLAKQVKEQQKQNALTIEEKFIGAIDSFLVSSSYNSKKERLAFRPSSYYKCKRQVYYFLSGVDGEKRLYPRSQRILQVGTKLHEWVQEEVLSKMEEYGVTLLPMEELPNYGKEGLEFIKEHGASPMEIKFLDYRHTTKFPISGMVDGWMEFENISFLFEFKTINPNDFSMLIEPLKDHVKQGAIYSLSLGVKKVLFLYLCKGTQNLKAYMVTYNEQQLEWVEKLINEIEENVLEKELPDKEEGLECRYCAYSRLCKENKNVNN